jgi:hypothetical protein
MKATASLFFLLLASQALPWALQPAIAQTAFPTAAQREDESDGRRMQLDYTQAYAYASRMSAYSAEEVTEKKLTLADGNQITQKQTGMRYGDQEGRVRISYKAYNGNERIFIADPRAKVAYLIRPNRNDVLRVTGEPAATRLTSDPLPLRAPDWNKEVTTSLGIKEFDGVKALGTLTETFYPAGARGNEREMVETRESWRAKALPTAVYSRTFSARDGERIVRLENLKFGPVPESLFTVPADQPIRDIVLDTKPAQH